MGSTSVSTPAAPAQPSTADAVNAWVASMPTVYQTQMQYAPLEAQQQVELAQQYAAPLAQAYYDAQKTMYPDAVGMQEQLAQQANAGMTAGLSDWEKRAYQSDMAAQLGSNAGSGIGADYMSRGMLQQQQARQDYYRNIGLSVAGLQPTQQAQGAQTSNYMSSFTPQSVMNYTGQNYGNYSGAYSSMYGANAGLQANANNVNQKYVGMGMGMMGSLGI